MIVVVAVTDMFFQSKIIETAHAVDGDIVLATTEKAVYDVMDQLKPGKLIIDLNDLKIDAISTIKGAKAKNAKIITVGFVSHVQRDLQARAKVAGCDQVLARSEFVDRLPELLRAP